MDLVDGQYDGIEDHSHDVIMTGPGQQKLVLLQGGFFLVSFS